MPAIGTIGARLDLTVRAGDTLGPFELSFTDPDTGAAMDLTGVTLTAAISKTATADGDLPMTVTVTDATGGKATLQYDAASTATMAATDFFKATEQYSWYLKRVDATGKKDTLLFGVVKVAAGSPS